MAEWLCEHRTDGAWRVTHPDGTTRTAHAVTGPDDAVWVHLEGEVLRVPAEPDGRARSHAHGHATLEAPMPAQVTAVLVQPGDDVAVGTTLLLLEAMKMELPLKAPTAGRVEAIHCAPGDRVAPGRALVDLVGSEMAT